MQLSRLRERIAVVDPELQFLELRPLDDTVSILVEVERQLLVAVGEGLVAVLVVLAHQLGVVGDEPVFVVIPHQEAVTRATLQPLGSLLVSAISVEVVRLLLAVDPLTGPDTSGIVELGLVTLFGILKPDAVFFNINVWTTAILGSSTRKCRSTVAGAERGGDHRP